MSQPELYEYGIHTEKSDIRAHVSVVNTCIYVFRTKDGIDAVVKNNPRTVFAYQQGVEAATASGWLVKPEWINDLRILRRDPWPQWKLFSPSMSTGDKGALAVECVCDAIAKGRFPFWVDTKETTSKEIQISGADIVVSMNQRIQVKCDYKAGPYPGTGHLFLQKSERNPLGIH